MRRRPRTVLVGDVPVDFWILHQAGSAVLIGKAPGARWFVVRDPFPCALEEPADSELAQLWEERALSHDILARWESTRQARQARFAP